ncbi:hypothetical protein F9L16_00975 [Agarivorans sp. B2Z047]|uniref:hypothetical protein n=1 Tax=Agarivorans sp. B2Z047 TaxID=2652721 RepID=UPI00128AE09D|nr:hypothetical protein [Agarivorans sp. B2Z047]MPW27581.1 hypothetical protein [Agarivorans sp. B2Z047]UQN44579.1 hypothetical protein LQZ07_08985 [Agarivorans sp. B2Z047]
MCKEKIQLEFLTNYLLQARVDIVSDKLALTRITYIKIALFGLLLTQVSEPAGMFAVIFLPFALYIVDSIHLSKLRQIFVRWQYIVDQLIPQISKLQTTLKLDSDLVYLEQNIVAKQSQYFISEAFQRTLFQVPALFNSLIFLLAFCHQTLAMSASEAYDVAYYWCFLVLLFAGMFFLHKCFTGQDTCIYRWRWIVLGSGLTLVFISWDSMITNRNLLLELSMHLLKFSS